MEMATNTLQMNLSALQRQDRAITAIIETSPQVTLYSFDVSRNQWSRTEIEGSLFICERSGDPNCCIIILNKKDPRNHTERVSKSFEFQVQEKFLLYKSTNERIYGLWFYDEKECNRIASSLQRAIKNLEGKVKTPKKTAMSGVAENVSPLPTKTSSKPVAQRNGQSSILALLSQAQQRYEEDRKRQHSPNQSSPPQEALTANKFIYSGANANQSAPVIQISSGNGKAIKIIQKPKLSPDSEKSDSVVPVSSSAGSSVTPFSPLSNRMCPVQQPVDNKTSSEVHSPIASIEESPASIHVSQFTPIKQGLSPSSSSTNLSLTFASNLLTPELLTMSLVDQDNLLNFQAPQATEALLSPEALLGSQSPVSSGSLPSVNHMPLSGFAVPDVLLSESSGAISPTVGTGNGSTTSPMHTTSNGLLTREQLRLTLITLIQTDDDLVAKIHEAYIRRCVYSD